MFEQYSDNSMGTYRGSSYAYRHGYRLDRYYARDNLRGTARKPVISASLGQRAIGKCVNLRSLGEFNVGPSAKDLAGDLFQLMYQQKPVFRDDKNIPVNRQINKKLIDWVMSAPSFERARHASANNMAAASASASLLWENLTQDDTIRQALQKQDKHERQQPPQQSQAPSGGQGKQKSNDKQKCDGDGEGGGDDGSQEKSDAAKALARAAADIEAMTKKGLAKGMMKSILDEAGKAADRVDSTMNSWGLNKGDIKTADQANTIVELSAMEEWAQMSELVGRLSGLATETIDDCVNNFAGSPTSVALTKKIHRLLPLERIYLSDKAPEYIRRTKTLDLLETGLLGWEKVGDGDKRGSFVAMVDESGSMKQRMRDGNGDEIMYVTVAKGIALGVARALHNADVTKRKYQLVGFSTRSDTWPRVTSDDDWVDHINWAKKFIRGGGTDFVAALLDAMRRLEEMHEEKAGADCLFITDGHSNLSMTVAHNWRKLKERTGSRLIYVSIGSSVNYEVRELADKVFVVNNLDDHEQLTESITSGIVNSQLDKIKEDK